MRYARRLGPIALAAILGCAQRSPAQTTLEEQLRSEFLGRIAVLKSQCPRNKLSFGIQGNLDADCPAGPSTIYRLFHFEELELTASGLTIKGSRVLGTIDVPGSTTQVTLPFPNYTTLSFQLAAPLSDVASARPIVALAFDGDKAHTDKLALFAKLLETWETDGVKAEKPPPLRPEKDEVYIIGTMGPGRPVYRCIKPCSEAELTAPKAISQREPEYSDDARAAQFHGVVVLHVVVNEEGKPELIAVARRAGRGLDENAVAAVAHWKFKPARMRENKVAVAIAVEFDFHRE